MLKFRLLTSGGTTLNIQMFNNATGALSESNFTANKTLEKSIGLNH